MDAPRLIQITPAQYRGLVDLEHHLRLYTQFVFADRVKAVLDAYREAEEVEQ